MAMLIQPRIKDDSETKYFKEKSHDGQVGPISARVLAKVVKTKVKTQKSQRSATAVPGEILTSVTGANLNAFHAHAGSEVVEEPSSPDPDPMELDLGDVIVDDERDKDYNSTDVDSDEETDAGRVTRSGRHSKQTKHFDDAVAEPSPSREGMATRRRSGRVAGMSLSRHDSSESAASGLITRSQKRKRQSSGLGQSLAEDSE